MAETPDRTAPAPLQAVPGRYKEGLYFRLIVKGLGHDPRDFNLWKFLKRSGEGSKVGVFARGVGAVYEADESASWTSVFAEDLKNGRFSPERPPALQNYALRTLREVISSFEKYGLQAGLELLNQRVPHRFTAVYRLQGGVMRNVALVDKERSMDTFSLEAVPLTDSFCQFALKDGFFLTKCSGGDQRLAGHPYSGVVGSYVGVPIAAGEYRLYGTLCHFDFADQQIAMGEFLLLQHVALNMPLPLLV
jgi:GAF domain-containing protein